MPWSLSGWLRVLRGCAPDPSAVPAGAKVCVQLSLIPHAEEMNRANLRVEAVPCLLVLCFVRSFPSENRLQSQFFVDLHLGKGFAAFLLVRAVIKKNREKFSLNSCLRCQLV